MQVVLQHGSEPMGRRGERLWLKTDGFGCQVNGGVKAGIGFLHAFSRPARKNATNRNLLRQNFIAYIFRSQRAREQESKKKNKNKKKQEREKEQEKEQEQESKSKREKKNKNKKARERMAKPRLF